MSETTRKCVSRKSCSGAGKSSLFMLLLGNTPAALSVHCAVQIGVVGAGRIGGNLAAQWARRGHDVLISFKRDRDELAAMADAIGAGSGSVGDAVDHGDVIVVSVPWPTLHTVANDVPPAYKVLIDTTNQ